ncbi:MAG: hypothetical protein IJQ25_00485, partial [Oscillibacter sp.]|nr:hypothetical protein [Oscillibacter sp.]
FRAKRPFRYPEGALCCRAAVEKAGKCPFYGTPPADWEKFSKSFQIFLPFRAGNFRIAIENFRPLP